MKNTYTKPTLSVTIIKNDDIITTSSVKIGTQQTSFAKYSQLGS